MESEGDPYNLQRFVDAQNPVFEQVCIELRGEQKQSHWMWFIFPQLKGLGHSGMSMRFAISCRKEAEAYLEHIVLGPRLKHCTRLVNFIEGRSIYEIFGSPDSLKFHSSMTLFASVRCENQVFKEALHKYFADKLDSRTVEQL